MYNQGFKMGNNRYASLNYNVFNNYIAIDFKE